MTSEDFKHSIVVTKMAKRLAWLVVIVLNMYFVCFSVLRGITRSTSWQVDYLLACTLQLFVDILVYETVECLWIHFTIPKLVSEDIATTMNTVKHAINSAFTTLTVPTVLDSPKYFFVSRHLAEEFPHLFESSIVLAFQSYFPPSELDTTSAAHEEKEEHAADQPGEDQDNTTTWGLHYHDIHVRRKPKKSALMTFLQRFNFSVLLMATLQHLGTVPIRFQQLIIHTLQPILFSFIIIFYFFLVKYPMIALFPMAFLFYEIIMYANRSKHGPSKSVPAINDAAKNTSCVEAYVADANERSRRQTGAINAAVDESKGDDDDDDGKEERRESNMGRVFTAAGRLGQRGVGSGHSDDDPADNGDSDSDSEGSDSDDYHERNFERRMQQLAHWRENYHNANGDGDGDGDGEDDDDDSDARNEEEGQDIFDMTSVVPLSSTETRLLELQQELYQADDAVKHMCVRIGLNEPEDFDFYWEETSDEYRYLYQRPITPFVNSHGEQVRRQEIVSMRNNVMIIDEVNMKRNTDLARKGIQRWKQFMLDWDNFRLYESDLALPFIDHAGHKVTIGDIETIRSLNQSVPPASDNIPIVKEFYQLKRRKQVLEHQLLTLEDDLARQREAAGNTPIMVSIDD